MQREERQRRPHHPLQLHVHDVFEPIGAVGEDDSGDDSRAAAAGKVARQREHGGSACRNRAEQEQVVHQQRTHPCPQQRRPGEPLDDHRVGEGQRRGLGIENIGVEQLPRRGGERVGEPAQPPHVEEDILVRGGAGRQLLRLRPRRRHGEQGEDAEDDESLDAAPGHQFDAIPISCISLSALVDVASPVRRR